MNKGKFGIRLCFYTVSAFILAYLGSSTVLFLLAGVVLFVEKDEWAGKQVIQAICLCFIESLIRSLLTILNPVSRIPVLGNAWSITTALITSIISMLVLVFCVVGIINNLKGKDAGIVGASQFADWAYGVAKNNNAQ